MTALVMLLAAATAALLLPAAPLARLAERATPRATAARPEARYPAWLRATVAGTAGGVLWLLLPAAAPVALVVTAVVFVASGRLRKRVSHRAERSQLADALEFLAVCLDAGAPVRSALHTVVTVSPRETAAVLRRVLTHLDLGRSAEEAWAELRDHPVWTLPARDMVRSARSGTSLADTLRLHADDARVAHRDASMKRARTVGVRSVVPLMACFLPAFVLIGVVPIIAGLLGNLLG